MHFSRNFLRFYGERVMKKFSVHPISMIVWLWLLIVLGPVVALSYVLAIIVHELGHYVVAKKLGYTLSKFSFSPYGVSLSYTNEDLDFRDELLIALAGPVANLVSALLIVGVWWLFPSFYFYTESLVSISVVLALFNLLPAYPLDGGRVFICLGQFVLSQKTARKMTIIFNIVFSIVFFVLFVVFAFYNFNPTYLLFYFFLVGGILDLKFVTKFEKISVLNKRQKDFTKLSVLTVSPETTLKEIVGKMQTSKTNLFCLVLENGKPIFLSEKLILKLLEIFGLNEKVGNIIKKQ